MERIVDLRRPDSWEIARRLTDQYTEGEPEILRRDFYNSLLAAFTPEEVRCQLTADDLSALTVEVISDHHLMVWGTI